MDLFTINIITLAYLGDAIYEVYVREHLISTGVAMVDELQKEAIKYVSAKSQSRVLTNLIDNDHLTEEERSARGIFTIFTARKEPKAAVSSPAMIPLTAPRVTAAPKIFCVSRYCSLFTR